MNMEGLSISCVLVNVFGVIMFAFDKSFTSWLDFQLYFLQATVNLIVALISFSVLLASQQFRQC